MSDKETEKARSPMKVLMIAISLSTTLLLGQSSPQNGNSFDVAVKSLKFVPSKPHVGDRLWIRFDVVNLSDRPVPGRYVDVAFYLDGEKIIWSGGYPIPLRKEVSHSVAEQYLEPLTAAGAHKYKLVVTLQKGAVDVDTTNNVIEGVVNVLE
jgi:hypothetical protein